MSTPGSGMSEDRISKELRAVEREIDAYYLENVLVREPFARAGWYFLAFCEEVVMRDIIRGDSSTEHEWAVLVDNLIIHAQWPLKWLIRTCSPGGEVPQTHEDKMYSAAWQLSELAMRYMSFTAAFDHASCGLVALNLDGTRIKSSSPMRSDTRFEAYDRLIPNKTDASIIDLVEKSFSERVRASVRVRGDSFDYDLNPQVVHAGREALAPVIDSRFALPADWRFPHFTLREFRQVARVLWVLAFTHFQARVAAAELGCQGLGISRALLLMEMTEIRRRVRRYSGVLDETVSAILEILTYGQRGRSNPDPALQPIIPLSPSVVAISPSLLLNSSMEPNLSVLLNRLPEEKGTYSALSQGKEIASRQRLVEGLSGLRFQFWHGQVPEWGKASEIDLAIVSDEERQCLLIELKSFISPAEPREVRERSEEIQKGIKQVHDRMEKARTLPEPLRTRLRVDGKYKLTWAVASETSIGAAYVQSSDVPVINVQHLMARLRRNQRLATCCLWLQDRAYLPIEGIHYKEVSVENSIGNWTLEWSGFKCLTDNYIYSDRPAD